MKYKYPQLNDREWLYDQYIIKNNSAFAISRLLGCKSSNSVTQALLRLNIPIKQIDDAWLYYNGIDIQSNMNVINGSLLGDAGLKKWDKNSINANAYFYKKNKYIDHIQFVASMLLCPHDTSRYIFDTIEKCNGKQLHYYTLRTPAHKIFTDIYDAWYPIYNEREKVVPCDLTMNPDTLLHWFLDDGNSYNRKRVNQRVKQIVITLCCEGFKPEYVELLRDICVRDTGIPFKLRKYNQGYGLRITIPQSASNDFFDYIGICPVESLNYKWK